MRYQFLQDITEFFSWQAYGLKAVDKRWKRIIKKTQKQTEQEYKLAIIEADDFLYQILYERGYEGANFEQKIGKVGKKILPNFKDILDSHKIRNSIVYDVDYKLDIEKAKTILTNYENAIKNIAIS